MSGTETVSVARPYTIESLWKEQMDFPMLLRQLHAGSPTGRIYG